MKVMWIIRLPSVFVFRSCEYDDDGNRPLILGAGNIWWRFDKSLPDALVSASSISCVVTVGWSWSALPSNELNEKWWLLNQMTSCRWLIKQLPDDDSTMRFWKSRTCSAIWLPILLASTWLLIILCISRRLAEIKIYKKRERAQCCWYY